MHAHDGIELLLCMPPGGDAPLADQITAHLDGLLTGSTFTPIPHLTTTEQHRAQAHGASRVKHELLTCCALPARFWHPGHLIIAAAISAIDAYHRWHTKHLAAAPAAPLRCFLPFTPLESISEHDQQLAVAAFSDQPLIAALRDEDPDLLRRYSGPRLEAITADVATYVDYHVGSYLLPDVVITADRQLLSVPSPARPHGLTALREILAHRDRIWNYLSGLPGDTLLATVAVGGHPGGADCDCIPG